jgi:hypothetical protein
VPLIWIGLGLFVALWLLALSEQDTDGPDDMPGWD